jgi:hypothetical protein
MKYFFHEQDKTIEKKPVLKTIFTAIENIILQNYEKRFFKHFISRKNQPST